MSADDLDVSTGTNGLGYLSSSRANQSTFRYTCQGSNNAGAISTSATVDYICECWEGGGGGIVEVHCLYSHGFVASWIQALKPELHIHCIVPGRNLRGLVCMWCECTNVALNCSTSC